MDSRLPTIFAEVADLSPAERTAYFRAHDTPEELVMEIESLLRFDDDPSNLLTGIMSANVEQLDADRSGETCGPYRLVRLLGQGGMGSVYLAERTDGEIDLRAAIKFVRGPGVAAFNQRFFRERQILASLNHPGVARLLDAGHTPGGQPYLVMEYIDGEPIDRYAASLRLREKLALFLEVCAAVSYLHHNLVIHRDLKPSNILIERSGSPKLLDFGIAAMLDETAPASATGERLLTPDYASPEQIQGAARTTATDVYSLAVVLYQLLTGQSPYTPDRDSSTEQLVLNAPPIPARRIAPGLPRDLEFVLGKALRKDPADRYPTVDGMAADLRAVLESRPIQARSQNALYVARRFFRRHWLTSAAGAAAVLSLAIGLYTADRQRQIAQNRFNQLRQLSSQVLELDGDVRGLPGSTKVREQIAAISMRYLDGLGRDVTNDPDLTLEVAKGRILAAEIQGVPTNSSLGRYDQAEQTLRAGAELIDHVLSRAPRRPDALALGAETATYRMIVADQLRTWDAEAVQADRASAYIDRLFATGAATKDQLRDAARFAANVGQAQMNMHRYDKAVPAIRRALELMHGSEAGSPEFAQATSLLANAQRQAGDLPGALESATKASRAADSLAFPSETSRARILYAIYWREGLVLGDTESVSWGRTSDAIAPFRKAFDVVYQAGLRDPVDASIRDRIATAGTSLGDALLTSNPAAALSVFDQTIAQLRQGKEEPARLREARALSHSSYALCALRRAPEAKQRVDAAFALQRSLPDYNDRIGLIGGEWDNAVRAQANLDLELNHLDAARAALLDLQEKLRARKPNPETDLVHAAYLSRLYLAIEKVSLRLGKKEEAGGFAQLRGRLWRGWDRKLPNNWYVRQRLRETPDALASIW